MDVLFVYDSNISNITIHINRELADKLYIGDELEFSKNSSKWNIFSNEFYLLADFITFFFKIYPKEQYMYIKVKRKIYVNGGNFVRFIAIVQSPVKE